EVDLTAIADDRIARAAPFAAKSGVRILRYGEGSAFGDPDALAGAVENLLRNAIEASPKGGEVVVHIGTAPDGTAFFDVEDSGPGDPGGAPRRALRAVLHHQAGGHRPRPLDLPPPPGGEGLDVALRPGWRPHAHAHRLRPGRGAGAGPGCAGLGPAEAVSAT